jgi:hypothetical protein
MIGKSSEEKGGEEERSGKWEEGSEESEI